MTAVLPPGRLVAGLQLPVQSQSTIYVEPWETTATAADLAQVARAADRCGFWYVGVCDHVAIPRSRADAMGTEWWDTVATLGWLAGITERVRLLSHITVPAYRHPLLTAKAWSTLDVVSGGRMILGVGAGHLEPEFAVLGVDFDRRGSLLDEAIDALRACFADEFPEVDGPTWSFRDLGARPRPVQAGGPPMWVGGSSRPARRRAAERADGWLPQGPTTPELVAELRHDREAAGGDVRFDIGALAGAVYVGEPGWDVGPCLTGPPEKVAHVLGKLRAFGVGQVQVRLRSRSCAELIEQVEAFGTEVIPLFGQA